MYHTTPGVPSDQVLQIFDCPRWVRVRFNGEVVADSRQVRILRERGHTPVYYFPPEDVDERFLVPSEHHTTCPYKGQASYWTVKVGDKESPNAMWSYTDPIAGSEPIQNYRAFYWDRMDHWYEEEEEIFQHPRDPFKRVDAISSSRHVQVLLNGVVLADSRRPVLVFETGLPTRYYLPLEDVHQDLLTPTDTHTVCPYKGTASYWSVTIDGSVHPDVVWSYLDPIPEISKIRKLLSFYPGRVDQIVVDGHPLPKE